MLHRIILFVLVITSPIVSQEFLLSNGPTYYFSYNRFNDKIYASNRTNGKISEIDRKTGQYFLTNMQSWFAPVFYQNKNACLYLVNTEDTIRYHDFIMDVDSVFTPIPLPPSNDGPQSIPEKFSLSRNGKRMVVEGAGYMFCYDLTQGLNYTPRVFPFAGFLHSNISWGEDSTFYFYSYSGVYPALFRFNVVTGAIDTLLVNPGGYVNSQEYGTNLCYFPATKSVVYLLSGFSQSNPYLRVSTYSTLTRKDSFIVEVPAGSNDIYPIAFSDNGKYVSYGTRTVNSIYTIYLIDLELKKQFPIRISTPENPLDMKWISKDTVLYSTTINGARRLFGFNAANLNGLMGEENKAPNYYVKLYPMPTSGVLHFEMNEYIQTTAELSIFNVTGELVAGNIRVNLEMGKGFCDLSDFAVPGGVYFYILNFSDQTRQPIRGKILVICKGE